MAVKTYYVGARLVVERAHRYLTRWQAQLEANLTAPQYTCVLALIAALAECLVVLVKPAKDA